MRTKTKQKILQKVKSTYDEIADEFSQTRHYSWPEFKFFEKHLQEPQLKILDLGCGNGRLVNFLDKNHQYTGVDISSNLIKQAKKLHPKHKFQVGDMLDLSDLHNEHFDRLICVAAFHHIPSQKSRLEALKNMYTALKPDGTLILTVWNLWQPKYRKYVYKAFLRSLVTLGNYHPFDTFIPWGKKKIPRYYHCFTPKEMFSLLKKAKFKVLEAHITKGKQESDIFDGHNQIYICKK